MRTAARQYHQITDGQSKGGAHACDLQLCIPEPYDDDKCACVVRQLYAPRCGKLKSAVNQFAQTHGFHEVREHADILMVNDFWTAEQMFWTFQHGSPCAVSISSAHL